MEIIPLLKEYTDLLIVECAHFSPEKLCEALRTCEENIGIVVVTHMHPSLYGREEELEEMFSDHLGCKVIVARDNLELNL